VNYFNAIKLIVGIIGCSVRVFNKAEIRIVVVSVRKMLFVGIESFYKSLDRIISIENFTVFRNINRGDISIFVV